MSVRLFVGNLPYDASEDEIRAHFAAAGNLLPDFPLVNKSFELCYACADR